MWGHEGSEELEPDRKGLNPKLDTYLSLSSDYSPPWSFNFPTCKVGIIVIPSRIKYNFECETTAKPGKQHTGDQINGRFPSPLCEPPQGKTERGYVHMAISTPHPGLCNMPSTKHWGKR